MFDVNGAVAETAEDRLTAAVADIVPLGDRVVVVIDEAEELMASGLYTPDIAKEAPQTGRILAVGPGRYTDAGVLLAMQTAPGDRVQFGKYSGTALEIERRKVLVIRESDVLYRWRRPNGEGDQ